MSDELLAFAKYFSHEQPYICSDDCIMTLIYDSDRKIFDVTVEKLTASGYELLQQTQNSGNIFALVKGKFTVTLLFCPAEKSIRLTFSENSALPRLAAEKTDKKTQPVFYAFENDHSIIDCGMCLIIQSSDYGFFIIDSGHYFQFNDNDRIYSFLRKRTPEGQKIVIKGWLITHAHTDHISKLIDFLLYNTDDVIIEGFYHNILPLDYDNDFGNREEKEIAAKLINILENYPAPVYRLHSGMKFYIGDISFDVLYTHEDAYPKHIEDFNDSSLVLMLNYENTKIFIPGDAAVLASAVIEARYGKTLKSDVVQVSHHGHRGLSEHCYELIDAETAVFPVTRVMFENGINKIPASKKACELAKKYYITSDGTVAVPLPYTSDRVFALPDETTEDFAKINRIWKYTYTEEYMEYIYETFLKNGGNPEKIVIPSNKFGYIEPK